MTNAVQSDHNFEVQDIMVNMGPQHPATHGVFRMVLAVDGSASVTYDEFGLIAGGCLHHRRVSATVAWPSGELEEHLGFSFVS